MCGNEVSWLTLIGFPDVEVGASRFQREDKELGFGLIVFEMAQRDLPGSPVGKTLCSQCRGPRFDPWLGN